MARKVFRCFKDAKGVLNKSTDMVGEIIKSCESFPPNTQIKVTVDKVKEKRTLDMNAYYWGVVLKHIGDFQGEDDLEEVHEDMKNELNPTYRTVGGELIKRGGSTKGMEIKPFWEYIQRCVRFAAIRLNVTIPDPDPKYKLNLTEAPDED